MRASYVEEGHQLTGKRPAAALEDNYLTVIYSTGEVEGKSAFPLY